MFYLQNLYQTEKILQFVIWIKWRNKKTLSKGDLFDGSITLVEETKHMKDNNWWGCCEEEVPPDGRRAYPAKNRLYVVQSNSEPDKYESQLKPRVVSADPAKGDMAEADLELYLLVFIYIHIYRYREI